MSRTCIHFFNWWFRKMSPLTPSGNATAIAVAEVYHRQTGPSYQAANPPTCIQLQKCHHMAITGGKSCGWVIHLIPGDKSLTWARWKKTHHVRRRNYSNELMIADSSYEESCVQLFSEKHRENTVTEAASPFMWQKLSLSCSEVMSTLQTYLCRVGHQVHAFCSVSACYFFSFRHFNVLVADCVQDGWDIFFLTTSESPFKQESKAIQTPVVYPAFSFLQRSPICCTHPRYWGCWLHQQHVWGLWGLWFGST